MNFRGSLTAAAAALLCCFTLGCPPAETEMPDDVNVIVPDDANTTETAPVVADPVDVDPVDVDVDVDAPVVDETIEDSAVEEVPASEDTE